MSGNGFFHLIRNFLFSKANREFLIFLFFLALSGIFWLSMTLNETYEQEITVPIHITNVPKNIVLTSNETDTVKVTIRDKGNILATYLYGEALKKISVNFRSGDRNNGTSQISASELQRAISKRLSVSSKIVSIKPERLDLYYNAGMKKHVAVRWKGRVIPEQLYYISDVKYSPDSIVIYAPEDKLDSIRIAYTEPLNYVNFRDSLSVDCQLDKIEGVKMVPNQVKVTFHTDVLTEESIDDIPIKGINLPKGKVLRTFPARVKVSFVTGVSVFRNLKASDFTVIADYNELKNQPSEKCNIQLVKYPNDITRATLNVKQVDYLIEEDDSTEE